MCVPSMVKLYDDQIMPPTKFLFQFSCIDTGQERQGADHCTERVVGVIWGEKTNKKTVQPHSMAEQDINSNIKLNMIIKWLQREKKKKVCMTFLNSYCNTHTVMYTANPMIKDIKLTSNPVLENTQILCTDSKTPPVFLSLPVYNQLICSGINSVI